MTLSTHVQLIDHSEVELQELFLVMRDIAGIPPEWPWTDAGSYGWYHVPDCPTAHARVDMGPTGFGPITVRWDTPYGYVHEGEGCGELHARFVVELGERRPQWRERLRWCDEFSGDWFDMGTDPFAVLCSAGAA